MFKKSEDTKVSSLFLGNHLSSQHKQPAHPIGFALPSIRRSVNWQRLCFLPKTQTWFPSGKAVLPW